MNSVIMGFWKVSVDCCLYLPAGKTLPNSGHSGMKVCKVCNIGILECCGNLQQ